MSSFEDEIIYTDADERSRFLPTQNEKSRYHGSRYSRIRSLTGRFAGAVLYALMTTMFVYATFSLAPLPHSEPVQVQRSPCGSSASEAQAAGCIFDIISFAWLPRTCYDEELSDSFAELAEWEWFLDVNQTQPVSKSEALSGRYPVLYVDWEYHITHCAFQWRKMHRAIMGAGKKAIDGYIGPLSHTMHCGNMLLSNREMSLDTVNTGIRVKYPDCGIA